MGGERLFKKPDQVWGQIPDEPQSQQTSFPGSRWTSSMMAFVRSSRLFSPVLCSPRKAMVRASSLLFVNTDIHLLLQMKGRRHESKATVVPCHCKKSVFVKNFQKRSPIPPSNKVRKKMKEIKSKGKKVKRMQSNMLEKMRPGRETEERLKSTPPRACRGDKVCAWRKQMSEWRGLGVGPTQRSRMRRNW